MYRFLLRYVYEQKSEGDFFENHSQWGYNNCECLGKMKADLCGADLTGAYLSGANLYGVKR